MLLFHRPLFFFGHAQKIPFFGHAQKILRHLNEPRFIERIGETLGQGETFRSVLAVFSRGYDHALEPFPVDVDKIRWTA